MYTTRSGQELPEDELNDVLPTAEDGVDVKVSISRMI